MARPSPRVHNGQGRKGPLDGIEELIPVPDRPVKGGKRDGTITVARRAMPLALSVPEISQAGVPPLTLLLQCSMSNIPQCSADLLSAPTDTEGNHHGADRQERGREGYRQLRLYRTRFFGHKADDTAELRF